MLRIPVVAKARCPNRSTSKRARRRVRWIRTQLGYRIPIRFPEWRPPKSEPALTQLGAMTEGTVSQLPSGASRRPTRYRFRARPASKATFQAKSSTASPPSTSSAGTSSTGGNEFDQVSRVKFDAPSMGRLSPVDVLEEEVPRGDEEEAEQRRAQPRDGAQVDGDHDPQGDVPVSGHPRPLGRTWEVWPQASRGRGGGEFAPVPEIAVVNRPQEGTGRAASPIRRSSPAAANEFVGAPQGRRVSGREPGTFATPTRIRQIGDESGRSCRAMCRSPSEERPPGVPVLIRDPGTRFR